MRPDRRNSTLWGGGWWGGGAIANCRRAYARDSGQGSDPMSQLESVESLVACARDNTLFKYHHQIIWHGQRGGLLGRRSKYCMLIGLFFSHRETWKRLLLAEFWATLPKRDDERKEVPTVGKKGRQNVKVVSSAEPFHRTKLIPNRLRYSMTSGWSGPTRRQRVRTVGRYVCRVSTRAQSLVPPVTDRPPAGPR